MKKLLLFIGIVTTNTVSAQDYNVGFETWSDTLEAVTNAEGCSLPADASFNRDPAQLPQWTSNYGVLRTTDAHSGSYAAVVCVWYINAPGRLALGQHCNDPNPFETNCKNHFPAKIYGISGYYKYQADSFMPGEVIS